MRGLGLDRPVLVGTSLGGHIAAAVACADPDLVSGLVLIGSMLFFTMHESRPVLHEILIGVFMTLNTPVTYLLLVRAALHRDRLEGRDFLGEK